MQSKSYAAVVAETRIRGPILSFQALVLGTEDVVGLLRDAVEREGGQSAFAKHHGVNRTYLNMVLNGKRPVSDFIAEAAGLRKVCIAQKSAKD